MARGWVLISTSESLLNDKGVKMTRESRLSGVSSRGVV